MWPGTRPAWSAAPSPTSSWRTTQPGQRLVKRVLAALRHIRRPAKENCPAITLVNHWHWYILYLGIFCSHIFYRFFQMKNLFMHIGGEWEKISKTWLHKLDIPLFVWTLMIISSSSWSTIIYSDHTKHRKGVLLHSEHSLLRNENWQQNFVFAFICGLYSILFHSYITGALVA